MTALLDRLVGVFARFQSREAGLRQQLAEALADDAADEAAIAAARENALAAMERAMTAEGLIAQLQASTDDANSQLGAIGTFLDQIAPALTDTAGEITAEEPAAEEVVAGDSYGADGTDDEPETADPKATGSSDQLPAT
jgi:hypothetical protein